MAICWYRKYHLYSDIISVGNDKIFFISNNRDAETVRIY